MLEDALLTGPGGRPSPFDARARSSNWDEVQAFCREVYMPYRVRPVLRLSRPDATMIDLGNVAEDIALLELAAPVEEGSAAPFPVGRLRDGAPLRIVSYSKDRAYVPSIAGPCPSYVSGDLVVLGCGVNWGASGAPVFAEVGGRTRLVAVVSAMTRRPGREGVALVLPAAPKMAALRAALEAATP